MKRLTLENKLRRVLEREEFELYFQPQIDVRTWSIAGAEALIRWRHPDLGLVSPAEFIPLAEEMGLILPIGEWVLRTASTQARAWHNAGHGSLVMAINSFIHEIVADRGTAAIIAAVIVMAHGLGLEVIAEGVETPEQRTFLFQEGCHIMQGYLFGRAVPAGEFEELLISRAGGDPLPARAG